MGHLAKDCADRIGIESRAIGRDPLECQVARIESRLQTPKKRFDIPVTLIVIEHLIQHPLILPIVNSREHSIATLIEFIDSRIARKRLKCPR